MFKHLKIFKNLHQNFTLIKDDFFQFGSPKKKTHKVHMNNAPSKNFKKCVLGRKKLKKNLKLQLIKAYENMVQF
jgi:hypothetical protein